MKGFEWLRGRFHPLHALRGTRAFRALTRRWDPMLPCRWSELPRPVRVRLLSHLSLLLAPGQLEPGIHETFGTLLRELPAGPGGCFWDVGANVGLFTWTCAAARPEWEIVSFEPDAKNLACLRRTARDWASPRRRIIPKAVAERTGCAAFHVDDLSGATGTLEDAAAAFNAVHYGHVPQAVPMETVALDDLWTEADHRPALRPPTLIKIDVEGAELRVLDGARRLLAEHPPIILVETFEHREPVCRRLEEAGYTLLDSDRRAAPTPHTHNFLALQPARCARTLLTALARVGYPVSTTVSP